MFESLHPIMIWLEDATARHAHTIALLEAVATVAAVIVALSVSYAARRASRPHITARVLVMRIILPDGQLIKRYIILKLINDGPVPIRLSANLFWWRTSFPKAAAMVPPLDLDPRDGHVSRRQYPFELFPQRTETIYLTSLDQFKVDMASILDSGRFSRKMSASFLRGLVYTEGDSRFRARLDGGVKSELKALAGRHTYPS